MPFSRLSEEREREAVDLGVFQGQAAVMLAIEHLNTGNGTMVKEVEGLDQRCAIKFTAEIFDTAYSQTSAVDTVINLISREPGTERLPSAFLGARWSSVSIPSSTVTGLKGYPQISPISTSASLDDKGQFPLFGRTIPSDASTAVPAILYLRNQLGVKHLAIAHVNDAYGDAYALGIQLAAEQYAPDMKVQSFSFDFDITEEIAERTIRQLKETNYRYIFGIIFSDVQYVPMMTEAYKQGIAGTGEHSWMFSDSVSPTFFDSQKFDVDSPVYKASMGASRISAVAGVEGNENFDTFFRSVNDLNNAEDIALIQSKHPTYDDPQYRPLQIEDNRDSFFDGFKSSTLVPFLYDAAIGLGLAACGAAGDDTYFDGTTHYETFKNTTFSGATGKNAFYQETGSRQANSASFIMMNVIEKERTGNLATLSPDVTDVFENGDWNSLKAFVFNDGSTVPHSDLPPLVIDKNYIGWAVRGIGLFMSFLILAFSVGLYFWTTTHRKTKVVKASQPMFLHMICGGCFLMATSMIFLSIDDEIASQGTCTATCITTPWFFCVGWILSFSALFAKTLRVNKIFHNPVAFSRIKVTMWDVIKPVVALLSTAVLILLLWTVLHPPVFSRGVSALDVYGRAQETKGTCDYTDSLPYAITLLVVLVGTLVYAVQQAYVARNISTEFAETEYIFLVLVAIFVTALLGIPVLLLVARNPGARFFAVACIVFLVNLAILCLIFIPKINQQRKEAERKKNVGNGNMRQTSFSIGSQRVSVSGVMLDTSEIESSGFQESRESDGESDGMKIIDNPRKVENLEQRIESLRIEIDVLRRRKQNTRLPSVFEASEEKSTEFDDEDEEEKSIEADKNEEENSTDVHKEDQSLDQFDEEFGGDQKSASGTSSVRNSSSSSGSHHLRVDMTGEVVEDLDV
ncbi:unnamed protein product [Cylindrotheca closterium]|uniref:G-protein coupled receptors family 3 profile domain-containing protein n=1 Tax=Cylindrotheca closterium TaxID=2856 RepID=A0AAD2CRS3_9STRA|nr:unnamed protein product [Cylindrotheca closterium]